MRRRAYRAGAELRSRGWAVSDAVFHRLRMPCGRSRPAASPDQPRSSAPDQVRLATAVATPGTGALESSARAPHEYAPPCPCGQRISDNTVERNADPTGSHRRPTPAISIWDVISGARADKTSTFGLSRCLPTKRTGTAFASGDRTRPAVGRAPLGRTLPAPARRTPARRRPCRGCSSLTRRHVGSVAEAAERARARHGFRAPSSPPCARMDRAATRRCRDFFGRPVAPAGSASCSPPRARLAPRWDRADHQARPSRRRARCRYQPPPEKPEGPCSLLLEGEPEQTPPARVRE